MLGGFGGNPNFEYGQIQQALGAEPVQVPVFCDALSTMRVHVCSTADIFVGGPLVSTTTGFRVPSGVPYWFSARAPLYFVPAAACTLTYALETA